MGTVMVVPLIGSCHGQDMNRRGHGQVGVIIKSRAECGHAHGCGHIMTVVKTWDDHGCVHDYGHGTVMVTITVMVVSWPRPSHGMGAVVSMVTVKA